MGKITVETCEIEGLKVITPTVFGDERGYFMETYRAADFAAAGITDAFVQDNQSCSHRGVLRGLHFQKRHQQAKLVRAISGQIFDVAVICAAAARPTAAGSASCSARKTAASSTSRAALPTDFRC